jgi:hypothetical protein
VNLGARAHAELSAGRLDETDATGTGLDRSADWLGVDLDLLLGRRWYLFLSVESYRGDLEENDQIHAGVAWRF